MKKNELKPWQKKEWCIPPEQDASFVCQMEEVLDMGAALLLRCLEPSYPSPLMSCVVISLFLQQSVAMWGEPWASLRILPGDCVGTPVVRGRPSTHQNRH